MAQILNLDSLLKKLDNFADIDLSPTMEKACLLVENDAKRNCPVDTGQLRASIKHEVLGTKEDITGVIGSNTEYAPYVEYGTGIYTRAPYEGQGRQTPWVYTDAKTGEKVFTRGSHPANGGIGFLEPALLVNENNIMELFKEAIKQEAKNV